MKNMSGFGGMILGLIFFVIVVPLVRTSCNRIVEKARFKEWEQEVDEQASRKEGLPFRGIYSLHPGTGGGYVDPVHGFFEFQSPLESQVNANLENRTYALPPGSPHCGKVVPCSRVHIQLDGGAGISIRARKTFYDTVDLNEMLAIIRTKFQNASIWHERIITIDGTLGREVMATISSQLIHVVKYKKHGLDHTIVFVCPWAEYSEPQETFVVFLGSYRSVKPG